MRKFAIVSIILITLSTFGFILALQSSHMAMGKDSGMTPGCIEHCLSQAAPFSQQNTIIPLVLLFIASILLGVTLVVYAQSQALGYHPRIIFDPLYLFKTVILRE